MAGAGAAAEAAAVFPRLPPSPARRELLLAAGGGASPRWWQRRRRLLRSAVPPGPGLGLLGLVFSRFCCSKWNFSPWRTGEEGGGGRGGEKPEPRQCRGTRPS